MISKRYRNKALRIYCDCFMRQTRPGTLSPEVLYEHGFPRKINALETTRTLAALGYVKITRFMLEGYVVEDLTDKGKCYFETASDERCLRWFDRLCGFVSGVATTFLAGVLVYWVTG